METLVFKNQYGSIISSGQANIVESYSRSILVDNVLKKVEYYSGGNLESLDFHLENEVIAEVVNQYNDIALNIVKDKQIFLNKYQQDKTDNYRNGVYVGSTFKVENILTNTPVFYKSLDQAGNVLFTEKYHYVNNELIYRFEYDQNGVLIEISDEVNNDNFLPSFIGTPGNTFSWTGLTYYQQANPMVPTS